MVNWNEIGKICGTLWAMTCGDKLKYCYEGHRNSDESFTLFCDAIQEWMGREDGVPDNHEAKENLCLRWLRELGIDSDQSENDPDFWEGFKAGADSQFGFDRSRKIKRRRANSGHRPTARMEKRTSRLQIPGKTDVDNVRCR